MQVTAKLIEVLGLQTGTGKNGDWKKQDFILETDDQYPKKICIAVWGDKIDEKQLNIGNQLKVDFDVESREYNSRWYTDLKAWKIEVLGVSTGSGISTENNNIKVIISNPISTDIMEESNDILPF